MEAYIEIFKSWHLLLNGLKTTMAIAMIGLVFGLINGSLLALACTGKNKTLKFSSKFYIDFFRSIPLLLVLISSYWLIPAYLKTLGFYGDLSLTIAAVGFTLFESAYFAEIIRTGIQAVPSNQEQAAISMGMSRAKAFLLVVLPQAYRNSFNSIITQFMTLIQDTSLVYVINMSDLFNTTMHIGENTGLMVESIILSSLFYLALHMTIKLTTRKIRLGEFK